MKLFFILINSLLCLGHYYITNATVQEQRSWDSAGEPLILTPYLKQGKIKEARTLSRVRVGSISGNVDSYSGYLTVNETYNSNIFFWFFPAQFQKESKPLLVWLQGGPGSSSLFGLFVENGPFIIDSDYRVQLRNTSWTLTHSMIFFDNPVGTGFSFTDHPEGYARSEDDIADGIYDALSQFYILFPEYKSRDLFVTGESYGGKYVPAVCVRIDEENQKKSPSKRMNLKGMAIGDAFTDPESLLNYSSYLYNLGLLDKGQRAEVAEDEEKIRNLLNHQKYVDARNALVELAFGGGHFRYASKLHNMTGLSFIYNFLYEKEPPEMNYYETFVQRNDTRRAIHVGNRPYYNKTDSTVWNYMKEDFMVSRSNLVEKLLDSGSKYRILLYQGQLDYCVTVTGTELYLKKLKWHGSQEWGNATRGIWRVGKDVAGYVKKVDNLSFIVVRNAGHMVPYDQPEWTFDMISRFTLGKNFEFNISTR